MERIVSSAEDLARVKVAIAICNSHEIKKEILCTPGSDYDMHNIIYEYGGKKEWDEIIEKKVTVMQEKLDIAKQLQEKVLGIVLLAGMRMLTWAEYHEGILGISRDCSFNLLKSSLFTQLGIIDNKKAAEELMKDESLNTKQKYKLACLYCFEDRILALFEEMTEEDKKDFYDAVNSRRIIQPRLVKYWSYYLMNDIEKLKGEKTLDQYRLEAAVKRGSIAAVEYCLEKTNLRRNDAVVEAAVKALRCRIKAWKYHEDDWIVFENKRNINNDRPWVPRDYYVDILSCLLSKMAEDQLMEFLKQGIERLSFAGRLRPGVLECFLNWPYQNKFMKMVELMWEFLPERYYAALLINICGRIELKEHTDLRYGEEKIYDYRELLREFWLQSPERFKRYVISNQEEYTTRQFNVVTTNTTGVRLIIDLLSLTHFTYKDRQNIELILAIATEEEKERIFSSQMWRDHCFWLMEKEKWEILERLSTNVFQTKEVEVKFKRELCFAEEAKKICICFVRRDEWNAAESFIKWSSLSEKEIFKLKAEMIYSEDGRRTCVDLVSPDTKLKAVNRFIGWYFPTDEEINTFRRELAFSYEGVNKFAKLVLSDQLELANEFMIVCLSSEGEVPELKKKVANRCGASICEDLIADIEREYIYDDRGRVTDIIRVFEGGKWEEVEKFLTWCFASDEEMSDFKKNVLLKKSGVGIHFNLIKSNRWEDAEIFFAWLGLSREEINELKKETLFNDFEAKQMFSSLMCSEEGDDEFVEFGSKEEAIELLLRWFLTDKETALEFTDTFKSWYGRGVVTGQLKALFENFDLAIAQRIRDLDNKRKSETSTPGKRHRNFKFDSASAKYHIG